MQRKTKKEGLIQFMRRVSVVAILIRCVALRRCRRYVAAISSAVGVEEHFANPVALATAARDEFGLPYLPL